MTMLRKVLLPIFASLSVAAMAVPTITVSSPVSNDFLGSTGSVRFLITEATQQHRVQVKITNVANPLISFTFTTGLLIPDVNQKIDGTLNLSFNQATPEGLYTAVVKVTQGGVYPDQTISDLTIDVNKPKFLDSNPINGAFVRGDVPIFVALQESNLELWRVQVNGQDIPNNTGDTNLVNVTWSTLGIERDGSQSININVKDKATNSADKSITVTLDRVAPSIQVVSPTGSSIRPNSTIPVNIDIVDQFNGSVTAQAINVLARRMNGTLIQRVTRISSRNNGGTLNWTGRIQKTVSLPSQFKLIVTAVDRAGNPAVTQEVIVNRN